MADVDVVFDWREWVTLEKDLEALASKTPKIFFAAITEIGLFIEREAKVNLTESGGVDTGRLRASIGHGADGIWDIDQSPNQVVVYVGTNVEYAPYVEYGFTMATPHVAFIKGVGFRYIHPFTFEGYHYMAKAAEATQREAPKILERHIHDALGDVFG